MNATARPLASRPLAPRPVMLAQPDHDEHVVRTSELVVLLLDALVRSYRFSDRERAILGHMLLGRSSGAIARALRIRETTVHRHMHAIFARTRTDGRRRLFDLALRLAATHAVVAPARRLAVAA